ncbi:hypothetical protein GY45DRAFT_1381037 [Cubamyces sp. BRFM 1775]|nr:hypothetical protein GY45DRAFT_1381037 [Cubamyces sp. BRFM 1775]
MFNTPKPYQGGVRKLVLGIDIGTTYSGVAYAILDPGELPKIHSVTRFPGQNAASDTKIPSILYYDERGRVHAIGAEATLPGVEIEAEDYNLVFVEWFKLHLRPGRLDSQDDTLQRRLPPLKLPAGKTVIDVFADFLGYLFNCTRRYMSETHGNGDSLWSSFEDRIEFILSHPNGWEGLQQGKMRDAAIVAGLIPDTPAGRARVQFVTEGEASFNFCIRNGLSNDVLQPGKGVMVLDAGGGTIDISSYSIVSILPISVQEVTAAGCIVQGSTQVDARAKEFLQSTLQGSTFGNHDDIKVMLDNFNRATKTVFKNANEPSYIRFGTLRCNDPAFNIRRGQLTLSGADMVSFFEPSRDGILEVVKEQRQTASHPISTVLLVGGFAANPWLFSALQGELASLGLRLFCPDAHTSKAVAEGAVSFYLDHFVSARVARVTYGLEVCARYDMGNPEHVARRHQRFTLPSGRVRLPDGFSAILTKGTRMREGEEISHSYHQESRNSHTLNNLVIDILCYRGKESNPRWVDVHPACFSHEPIAEMFTPLCTIYADTSNVQRHPRQGKRETYYEQGFDVVFICGSTELQAQIRWKALNGKEHRGPAKIVYDEDLQVSR